MKTGRRSIEPGNEFNYLFPSAKGGFVEIKKYAQLQHTVDLMKEVIATTLDDTKAVANMLKREDGYRTCEAIWKFCFRHLQYRRDQEGVEQVRRPSRTWQDRGNNKGVDCDCMTVFIGSILTNLRIPFAIRLTRYVANEFEHVYPVALIQNNEVIMDCVVHQFNYQVPYKQKKDIEMKLQYLNGIDDDDDYRSEDDFDDYEDLSDLPEDAQGLLLHGEDLRGLAGKAKRQEKKAARKEKREDKKEVRQEKKAERKEDRAEKKASKPPLKERIGKVLHVVNKVNPATALLRAGLLASMKLNIGHVAGKLRFSYWSDAQAQANNMDMAKFVQLKAIRQKTEKIFHGAGGKPENLKKSILEGNGNKDKRVSLNGLGAVTSPVNDYQSLHAIVGREIFTDEFSNVNLVNGLGEPVSATAAIAAASGAIGTIAALIKKLGELFKKGSSQAEKEAIEDNTVAEEEKSRKFSLTNIIEKLAPMAEELKANASLPVERNESEEEEIDISDALPPSVMSDHAPDLDDYAPVRAADQLPATTSAADEIDPTEPETEEFSTPSSQIITTNKSASGNNSSGGVMQWVKDHPVLTLVGAATIVAGTIAIVKSRKKSKGSARALNGIDGLDGTKKRRKSKKSTTRSRRSTTPARRRRTSGKHRGNFRKVELK